MEGEGKECVIFNMEELRAQSVLSCFLTAMNLWAVDEGFAETKIPSVSRKSHGVGRGL